MNSIMANHILEENIIQQAKTVSLTSKEYANTVKSCADLSLTGGIIYDALIFYATKKAKVDRLITFNEKHFKLFCKEQPNFIRSSF